MFNLIVKDILIQKKMFIFMLIYSLILIFALQKPPFSTLLYVTGAIAIVYITVVTAAAYDERSAVVLSSLPVRKQQIVLAKYCSGFVYAALGLLVMALTSAIISSFGLPVVVRRISMMDITGALAGAILFCSYYFPLYFQFGNTRIRYINITIFMLFFFAPNLVVSLLKMHQNRVLRLLSVIGQTPLWLLWSGMAAVLLALLLLSLVISLRVYEHKDL